MVISFVAPAVMACALMQAVDVKVAPSTMTVRQLTYAQLDGTRNAATIVDPFD